MSHVPVPPMPVVFRLGDAEWVALPKRFSSGSVGWYASTKMEVEGVRVQVSLSAVVIGTKPKAEPEAKAPAPAEPQAPEPVPEPPEPSANGKQPKTRSKALKPV